MIPRVEKTVNSNGNYSLFKRFNYKGKGLPCPKNKSRLKGLKQGLKSKLNNIDVFC